MHLDDSQTQLLREMEKRRDRIERDTTYLKGAWISAYDAGIPVQRMAKASGYKRDTVDKYLKAAGRKPGKNSSLST